MTTPTNGRQFPLLDDDLSCYKPGDNLRPGEWKLVLAKLRYLESKTPAAMESLKKGHFEPLNAIVTTWCLYNVWLRQASYDQKLLSEALQYVKVNYEKSFSCLKEAAYAAARTAAATKEAAEIWTSPALGDGFPSCGSRHRLTSHEWNIVVDRINNLSNKDLVAEYLLMKGHSQPMRANVTTWALYLDWLSKVSSKEKSLSELVDFIMLRHAGALGCLKDAREAAEREAAAREAVAREAVAREAAAREAAAREAEAQVAGATEHDAMDVVGADRTHNDPEIMEIVGADPTHSDPALRTSYLYGRAGARLLARRQAALAATKDTTDASTAPTPNVVQQGPLPVFLEMDPRRDIAYFETVEVPSHVYERHMDKTRIAARRHDLQLAQQERKQAFAMERARRASLLAGAPSRSTLSRNRHSAKGRPSLLTGMSVRCPRPHVYDRLDRLKSTISTADKIAYEVALLNAGRPLLLEQAKGLKENTNFLIAMFEGLQAAQAEHKDSLAENVRELQDALLPLCTQFKDQICNNTSYHYLSQ